MFRIVTFLVAMTALSACSVGFNEGRHGGGGHMRLGQAGEERSGLRPGVQLAYYDEGNYRHRRPHCWIEHGRYHDHRVCN